MGTQKRRILLRRQSFLPSKLPLVKTGSRSSMRNIFMDILSTEDNYSTDEMDFYGPYSHIREALDYTFFKNYRKERQWIQDSIIETIVKSSSTRSVIDCFTVPVNPWIVFFLGVYAVGKTRCIKELEKKGRLVLTSSVYIDSDIIKVHLPEYTLYAGVHRKKLDDLLWKEIFYISQIATFAALQAGRNIIVNYKSSWLDRVQSFVKQVRTSYTIHKIALMHVNADPEVVFEWAKKKKTSQGQIYVEIDSEIEMKKLAKEIKAIKIYTDYYCKLYNSPGNDIQIKNETWENFEENWIQTCFWN